MAEDVKPLDKKVKVKPAESVDVANEPDAASLKQEIQQLRKEMKQLREVMTGGTANG